MRVALSRDCMRVHMKCNLSLPVISAAFPSLSFASLDPCPLTFMLLQIKLVILNEADNVTSNKVSEGEVTSYEFRRSAISGLDGMGCGWREEKKEGGKRRREGGVEGGERRRRREGMREEGK